MSKSVFDPTAGTCDFPVARVFRYVQNEEKTVGTSTGTCVSVSGRGSLTKQTGNATFICELPGVSAGARLVCSAVTRPAGALSRAGRVDRYSDAVQ